MKKSQLIAIAIVAILALSAVFAGKLIGFNVQTKLLVKESLNGDMSCIDHPGFYFKGFANIYPYDRAKAFYFNSDSTRVNGEGWEGDDSDEDNVEVTMSRNAKAWFSGYVLYELPTDCHKLVALHSIYQSDKKIKHNFVRNEVLSAVRKTAPIFTAEEGKVTKFAALNRLFQDQVVEGEYLTRTERIKEKVSEDEVDSAGKVIKKGEYQEFTITSLKLDSNGNRIVLRKSELTKAGIEIKQAIIQKVTLDPVSQEQLDIVKKREMQRITKATEAETAKQDAITAEANGRAKIAEAKAEQEVEKMRQLTIAEKEKQVAIKQAEKDKEVARLNAEKAKYKADSIEAEGRAQAAIAKAKVSAGLTPQEKLAGQVQMNKDKWDAIARMQVPVVPTNVINTNGTGKGAASGLDVLAESIAIDRLNAVKVDK